MATASATDPSLECPICHDDFDQPKILPCMHIACKKCVLSWLSAKGNDGGCPICRAPIFSSTRPAQGQLATLVDALPTNFAVMALVESQQVLTSPHVCNMCDAVTAKFYCLQCAIKLCKGCVKSHNKIPSLKNHMIEEINKLTLDLLAETNRSMCKAHPDRLVEMFCPTHKEVICLMCASTNHESCAGKLSIIDAADRKRAELKDRACAMRQSEGNLKKQIQDVKDASRSRIDATFDDIQRSVETRRNDLKLELQVKLDDTTRASLASKANTLEQLVSTAPQVALLAMAADLTSRLDQLQSQIATTTAGQLQVPEFTIDDKTLRQLKSDISSLGNISMKSQRTAISTSCNTASSQLTSSGRASNRFAPYQNVRAKPASSQNVPVTATSSQNVPATPASTQNVRATPASSQNVRATPASSQNVRATPASTQNVRATPESSQTGPKPRGEELAIVLKVGDRVKPGPGWYSWIRANGTNPQGTVTAIPSRRMAAPGEDPRGWVDVRWDDGHEDFHRMQDVYELDLV